MYASNEINFQIYKYEISLNSSQAIYLILLNIVVVASSKRLFEQYRLNVLQLPVWPISSAS